MPTIRVSEKITAHFQPVVAHLRVFAAGHSYAARSPYRWSCTATVDVDGRLWLECAQRWPTADERRAIAASLLVAGFGEAFCVTHRRCVRAVIRIDARGRATPFTEIKPAGASPVQPPAKSGRKRQR